MSVEKKDFEGDRSSPGTSTSSVDESGPIDLSDPEAAARPRKKRGGLRVPSDNVPRPQSATTSGPVTSSAPVTSSTLPAGVSVPPIAPMSAPMSAPIERAASERAETDLEVDVEFVDEDAGAVPVALPAKNGSGRAAAALAEAARATDQVEIQPAPAAVSPTPAVAAVPDGRAIDRAWTESEELDADDLLDDEDRGEPTQISMAPDAPPAEGSTLPTNLDASVMASTSPVASSPSVVVEPEPAAAPTPVEAAGDAARSGSDDAEEISPTELEEVDSGPHAAASAPKAVPAGAAPVAPSPPAAVSPVQHAHQHPASHQSSPSEPQGRPHQPPPAPPPAAVRTTIPPAPPKAPAAAPAAPAAPPAPRAAVQAAAQAAAQVSAQPRPKKRKGKAWFEEIFDEDYLRTLPFLTPQATQREAGFLIDSLGVKPGQQVLDVGCGYGRHAMELAARGFHVVGLDLSLPLLIRGADEAQRRGLTINFVHGDMRELTFDAQFDGAYCVFSTFGYFDDETNKRVAQNVARALKPGARLVIDILNRDYIIADLPTRVWWEGDGCVVLEEVDFNYFTSRLVSNRSVVFEDGRQLEQEISIRAYSLHELGKLLHQVGFRVTEVSGGLATRGRFFGNDSRQIIVVAERRADKDVSESGPALPGTKPPA